VTSFKIIYFGSLFVAVILHEVSHGVVALFYGDDTAKRAGRLTLNPIPHIDPFGSILLPAMAVLANLPVLGWAKPVPVTPGRLRDPRRQMLYVGLVGPATNFVLMFISAVGARLLYEPTISFGGDVYLGNFLERQTLGFQVLFLFALVNLFLGVFNLLPIPPLDGSSLIERVLPARWLPTWWKIRPYGFLILFLALFYADILGTIIRPFQRVLIEFVVA
jgi:Zn-dependent protease